MGSSGLPDFATPMNTSEFEALIEYLQSSFSMIKSQSEVVGHDLRRMLPKAKNVQGGFLNLDLKAAAWQVARQFNQIAAAQYSSAAAASKALTIFHGNFTTTGGQHGSRTFDAGR